MKATNKSPAANLYQMKQPMGSSSNPNFSTSFKGGQNQKIPFASNSPYRLDTVTKTQKTINQPYTADKSASGGHRKQPTSDNLDSSKKLNANKIQLQSVQTKTKHYETSLSKKSPTSPTAKQEPSGKKYQLKLQRVESNKMTAQKEPRKTNTELDSTSQTLNNYGLYSETETSVDLQSLKRKGSQTTAENKLYKILNPTLDIKKKLNLRDDLYQLKLDVEKSKIMFENSGDGLKMTPTAGSKKSFTKLLSPKDLKTGDVSKGSFRAARDRSASKGFSFSTDIQSVRAITEFQMGRSIGKGKFGDVHLARHRNTGFVVAIKRIAKSTVRQYKMETQIMQQIKIHYAVNNPSIVQLYTFFDDAVFIYLVMEYMPQGTLFSLMHKKSLMEENEVAAILIEVGLAVKYLHNLRIAHRDIKPQNIVMAYGVAKLCDFGWSARVFSPRKTYCGTLDYAPPEILERKEYCEAVDMWCLGILTYQLLTGRVPFNREDRRESPSKRFATVRQKITQVQVANLQFPQNLSDEVTDFIEKLLKKNPDERMKIDQLLEHGFLRSHVKNF